MIVPNDRTRSTVFIVATVAIDTKSENTGNPNTLYFFFRAFNYPVSVVTLPWHNCRFLPLKDNTYPLAKPARQERQPHISHCHRLTQKHHNRALQHQHNVCHQIRAIRTPISPIPKDSSTSDTNPRPQVWESFRANSGLEPR